MVNVSIPALRGFTPAAIPPKPAPTITTLRVPSDPVRRAACRFAITLPYPPRLKTR